MAKRLDSNIAVEACPFCLSTKVDYTPGGAGAAFTIYGITGYQSGRAVCRDCGRMVLPIEFKSLEDYKKARNSIKGEKAVLEKMPRHPTEKKTFLIKDKRGIFGRLTTYWSDDVSKIMDKQGIAGSGTWKILNLLRTIMVFTFPFFALFILWEISIARGGNSPNWAALAPLLVASALFLFSFTGYGFFCGVLAVRHKDYGWAIGQFLFWPLAFVYRHYLGKRIREGLNNNLSNS